VPLPTVAAERRAVLEPHRPPPRPVAAWRLIQSGWLVGV